MVILRILKKRIAHFDDDTQPFILIKTWVLWVILYRIMLLVIVNQSMLEMRVWTWESKSWMESYCEELREHIKNTVQLKNNKKLCKLNWKDRPYFLLPCPHAHLVFHNCNQHADTTSLAPKYLKVSQKLFLKRWTEENTIFFQEAEFDLE